MENPNDRIKTEGAEGPPDGAAAPQTEEPATPTLKPPPPLPLFFMLSHLEEDGPVRLDGVKLGVCEVMGLELDEPKLGAFAGALNACDFPVQLLIRQHPPRLGGLRDKLTEAQPQDLPPQTEAASESLRRLLTDLETRDGILDRRFYAVCEFGRFDELRGLLARAGAVRPPLQRPPSADADAGLGPGRHPRRDGRGDAGGSSNRPPRGARRRPPGALPPTWASGPAPWPPASCKG